MNFLIETIIIIIISIISYYFLKFLYVIFVIISTPSKKTIEKRNQRKWDEINELLKDPKKREFFDKLNGKK